MPTRRPALLSSLLGLATLALAAVSAAQTVPKTPADPPKVPDSKRPCVSSSD